MTTWWHVNIFIFIFILIDRPSGTVIVMNHTGDTLFFSCLLSNDGWPLRPLLYCRKWLTSSFPRERKSKTEHKVDGDNTQSYKLIKFIKCLCIKPKNLTIWCHVGLLRDGIFIIFSRSKETTMIVRSFISFRRSSLADVESAQELSRSWSYKLLSWTQFLLYWAIW